MTKRLLRLLRLVMWISILGILFFFSSTSLAMLNYPGGTILERSADGYSFWTNFFSDLGRRRAWNGSSNFQSNLLFDAGMYVVGASLSLFFLSLSFVFKDRRSRSIAVVASLLGLFAAMAYFGIVNNPLDVNYRIHTIYVRVGFIAFLLMSLSFTLAILQEPLYPNHNAYVFIIFDIILFIQVCIMIFGPRSWSSHQALFLQVTAQKIVVYAQLLCMLYQCFGVLGFLRQRDRIAA